MRNSHHAFLRVSGACHKCWADHERNGFQSLDCRSSCFGLTFCFDSRFNDRRMPRSLEGITSSCPSTRMAMSRAVHGPMPSRAHQVFSTSCKSCEVSKSTVPLTTARAKFCMVDFLRSVRPRSLRSTLARTSGPGKTQHRSELLAILCPNLCATRALIVVAAATEIY